ncbi:RagB/SusD family nutrient uptake outer membrane protein [Ancylomarina salipaludis]|nr:RagB/SusD family nutrient uptake outer membrane protein [Ancylomarina salipaludis]
MKNKILLSLFSIVLLFSVTSCEDYVTIQPTGVLIPKTVADFEPLLEDEIYMTLYDKSQQVSFVHENYSRKDLLVEGNYRTINYYWDETGDRSETFLEDTGYGYYYRRIFYCNTILEADIITETLAEEEQKKALLAKARILRAYNYFDLINKYAKAYHPETAGTDGGILVKLTADMEVKPRQFTVKETYDQILEDCLLAVDDLKEETLNYIHPNKAFGYGFLARVYLHMHKYDLALEAAEKSLALNDYIYDWVNFYETNKNIPRYKWPEVEFESQENLFWAEGLSEFGLRYTWLYETHMEKYEAADTRALVNFEPFPYFGEPMYYFSRSDNTNVGGMKSTEVRMIRAELNARKGNLAKAMEDVNALRAKRILTADFVPLTAATTQEAMDIILSEKEKEFFATGIRYADLKRLNTEPEYARILTDHVHDKSLSLAPDSHLWVFPFAFSALEKNDALQQNTPR